MEGFDTILIFSFFAFPAFQKAYGTPTGDSGYEISSKWQFALTTGAEAGEIVGLLMNGFLADRIGYRWTLISSMIFLFLSILLLFFAVNIQMLLAAEILCGIPWGVFQTLSMTYAAEVMPTNLRAYVLSNINLCWIWGQLLATGILRKLVDSTSEWSYRIPFALQWAIGLPILVAVLFAPESPWWLIQHRRQYKARKSLRRLTAKGKINIDETAAMMEHTNEIERYLKEDDGGIPYLNAFKGVDRRRTEIACMVWITQQVCGTSLTGWATTFYEQAGFSVNNAFNLSLGVYGVAVLGAMFSWYLLSRVGRRKLYIGGLCGLFVILLSGGIVGSLPTSRGQLWALGSLLFALTAVYDMTIGPTCYVLVAEIPSTRLRIKTVVLARTAYNLAGILVNWMTPRMLSPTAWNWKGKSCFFFAGTTAFCLIWCYHRLPETFGLSYLEIDILFERKAKASKFHKVRKSLQDMGYFGIEGNEQSRSSWVGF
jgi:SP family general alpha glucoside:H+ symporter-like MFS transporter